VTEPKTTLTDAGVGKFIASLEDERKRCDSRELIEMMQDATGAEPKMWGSSIVGFGSYHYRYASGREGDSMLCGFSPRKGNLSVYIMPGFNNYGKLMKNLGKHSKGKSCLYIRTLDNIDREALRELIQASVRDMRAKYETTS